MNRKIIFIHGAWVTYRCWDQFKKFFEARGYTTDAPAWPFKDRSVGEQRAHPDPHLARLGITEIIDHYDALIRQESEPPILIGHSFGGLFVQMLLDRGLGAAGIAISSAPPKGVVTFNFSSAWALRLPLTTPFAWKKVLRWPFKHFQYAFVHTLPHAEQKAAYEAHVVPESGRLFWQGASTPFTNIARVRFENGSRAPLLLIAGSEDHIVPAVINRRNYTKQKASGVRTDFKEFPGRTHWIIAEPGWEEVAGFCEEWIRSL